MWAAVAAAVGILVLRKPWALLTPQLWAEDGSVHLNDVDAWGARAFLIPYRGYLHLLPRLIAWFAPHVADVAHWPGIYNSAALVVTAYLFARMASPRLNLPGKPWMTLAFVLIPHSGEVFLNITNLHWLADIFLVQQFLINRPATTLQRVGDHLALILAGLSDPCALVFLPLFVWRAWHDRDRDSVGMLVVVALCAGIQGYFLRSTGLHYDGPMQPFHLLRLLSVMGSRLVVWPFLGRHATSLLPAFSQALIGTAVVLVIVVWALRRDPRRPVRARILAAWALLAIGCLFRIRPDTWTVGLDNLSFAEPYFYATRLLLVWVVILEFSGPMRRVAWLARACCLIGVCLELPYYQQPAPTNYHWASHCDPIRRGVPAKIPILPDGWILQYPGRPPQK